MGQTGENWNKMCGEMGLIRLSGLDANTAPDSAVAGLESPGRSRQDQMSGVS